MRDLSVKESEGGDKRSFDGKKILSGGTKRKKIKGAVATHPIPERGLKLEQRPQECGQLEQSCNAPNSRKGFET